MTTLERRRLRVEGVVQGVGFRPYVHRLAAGRLPANDGGIAYGQAVVAAAREAR